MMAGVNAMSPAPQVFTLEEVNALLPRLRPLMDIQMGRRSEIEKRLELLTELLGGLPDTITLSDEDAPGVRDLKHQLSERVDAYQTGWREIEQLGAVLKDPRAGLLDFYGRVDGKLVWLCWKYGEEAVKHYHGLDEGFGRRKPILDNIRNRHLN
jgi:hypothetical protein